MGKKGFSEIRRYLGKTQSQLSQLLGTSLKAIESFEQGWRNIPVHTERQVLFLLGLKKSPRQKNRPCWVIRGGPSKLSKIAKHGNSSWASLLVYKWDDLPGSGAIKLAEKMKICRQRKVFRNIFPI